MTLSLQLRKPSQVTQDGMAPSLPPFHFLSLLRLGWSQSWDGPLLSVQVSMTHLVETSISGSV